MTTAPPLCGVATFPGVQVSALGSSPRSDDGVDGWVHGSLKLVAGGTSFCVGFYEEFTTVVARIAEIFPGPCKLTVDPPGYTIKDRARELCEEQEAQQRVIARRRKRV